MALGKKQSIEDFKTVHGATKLDIVKNPHTEKLFVSANGKVVGAVSTKWDQTQESEFVEIIDDNTGEILWCLHNKHTENIVASI